MEAFLHKSYKGYFPFKIATTSYIYPDDILPNVRMLAPYLDEIELVLFESSREDNLPSPKDIEHLVSITRAEDITYNVHLPIDIFLGDSNPVIRERGVAMVQKVIKLTGPLRPFTYTLHLSLKNQDGHNEPDIAQWRVRLSRSMEEILKAVVTSRQISVETLDYPFDLIEGILETFDLSVCLDLGHLILYGYSIADYVNRYLVQASVVHVHGVKDGKDHLSIDVLDNGKLKMICGVLNQFTGVVSVEVFSFHDLSTSLRLLEERCQGE